MEPELKSELLETLKSLRESPAKRSMVAAFLNSPFTVTLLGGLILAVVCGLLTQYSTNSAREREIAIEKLRQRQAFVDTFSCKVKMYFEMTLSMRKREIFLYLWRDEPDRENKRYPDGRTFRETRDKYEDDVRYWLDHSTGTPSELVYTAKILFSDENVRKPLEALALAAAVYQSTYDEDELSSACTSALTQLDYTAKMMADETHENP